SVAPEPTADRYAVSSRVMSPPPALTSPPMPQAQPAASSLAYATLSEEDNKPLLAQAEPAYLPPLSAPKRPPADAPVPATAYPVVKAQPEGPVPSYMDLGTRSGIDAGVQGYYYEYREYQPVDANLHGAKLGFTGTGTMTFNHGVFGMIDGRYGFGDVNYHGSGFSKNHDDEVWEIRGLAGMDFNYRTFSMSPYFGIGYRNDYSDDRGITTTNAAGYRRENDLWYVPLGVMPRFRIDSRSRITSKFETDLVVHGNQRTYLTDFYPTDPIINNTQGSGVGLRAEISYETPNWSIGPFINYWNIDTSTVTFYKENSPGECAAIGAGAAPCTNSGVEPHNYTIETGVQFKYHFF
ncbi:MAG TPA: hypothetical protein VFR09_01730, partial [Alphaproteobacteria bacterium]|nr:hypothetical protein [Alphaproteobacteria bacterium]